MTLAAGLVFFNAVEELKRCLPTLSCFDHIFCIDGPFRGYEASSLQSTDGSRELVLSFPNTVLIDYPNKRELEKRQKYLDMCEIFGVDHLLIIDSDEWIEGDFAFFKHNVQTRAKTLNVYNVPVMDQNYDYYYMYRPRLLYKPYELEYAKAHWILKRRDASNREWINREKQGYIEGIRIGHDHKLRSPDYQKKRLAYQEQLKAYESRIDLFTLEHEDDELARIAQELKSKE